MLTFPVNTWLAWVLGGGFCWLFVLAFALRWFYVCGGVERVEQSATGERVELAELDELGLMRRRALEAWARLVPVVGLDDALSMRFDEELGRELGLWG